MFNVHYWKCLLQKVPKEIANYATVINYSLAYKLIGSPDT